MGYIYFIQKDINGEIKIGFTVNIKNRLRTLQTSSPVSLRLLGYIEGTMEQEKELHKKFGQYRIRQNGEWFKLCQELIDYINQVNLKMVHLELNEDKKVMIYTKIKK